jgi:heme/copper-type cytochrome/quinol oxidase subunit 3
MEASSASAPLSPHIEPEPANWQPRAVWVAVRLWVGSVSFFFVAFLFAYFYLRSLDTNNGWKIGSVNPSIGLGVGIAALFALSAIVFRLGATRPTDTVGAGIAAIVMALAGIVLQFIEYTQLKFGAASGGYASVFFGWTALYAILAVGCVYWMETQIAGVWRARREGLKRPVREGVPAEDLALMRAGLDACSFFWAYYAAIGVLAFIILYLV